MLCFGVMLLGWSVVDGKRADALVPMAPLSSQPLSQSLLDLHVGASASVVHRRDR